MKETTTKKNNSKKIRSIFSSLNESKLTSDVIQPVSESIPESQDLNNTLSNYLKNVILIGDVHIKNRLMHQLPNNHDITTMCDVVKNTVQNTNKKWVTCNKSSCYKVCLMNVLKEINSTAYYLKILTASLLQLGSEYTIAFQIDSPQSINGLWKNDFSFILIKILKNGSEINISTIPNGRLIMGFGPSASGKTHCAKQIINLLAGIDPSFPAYFLSIDGGIYRQESYIYTKILYCIHATQNQLVKGFLNLMSTGLYSSIFNSKYIKNNINNYLIFLKQTNYIKMNLYVPETLGSCITCATIYKKYINITGDTNWVGTMIWQHKLGGKKCNYFTKYGEKYQCKGCTTSGEEREIYEGKKYSNKAWTNSYYNGKKAVMNAPNYRFIIHNSGISENWTVIKDYSNQPLTEDNIQSLETIQWKYVDKTKPYRMKFYFGGNATKQQNNKSNQNKTRRVR